MSHWSKIEERGIIWGMDFLLKVYLFFGRKVLQVLLYPVVSYYWLVNEKGRRASLYYLQRLADFQKTNTIKPVITPSFLNSYRHFISFANALIDKLAAWSGSLSVKDIEYHGREALVNHMNKGQGVLILASHLGNLEVCRVVAHLRKKVIINVLVYTRHADKFNSLLNKYVDSERLNLIQVTEVNAATAMLLQDKIAAGELIIIAADRAPASNQQNTQQRVVNANFLGHPALFPQDPFILGLLLKCPVYTLFCLKQKGKQMIYFDHFSDGLSFTRKQRTAAIEQCVQEYAEQLQHYCLKAPLQWFNFYDFWQTKCDEKDS